MDHSEKTAAPAEPRGESRQSHNNPDKADIFHSEVLVNQDLMNDAFDGENEEHEQGVWSGVKSHPWACFWAFIFCFTIVSCFPISLPPLPIPPHHLDLHIQQPSP